METRENTRRNVHVAVLLGLVAAALALQAVLWFWYIEDSAISFAFARNVAHGEGLVASIGGERVEGYSNPTWVALMALFELVDVDGFTSSKIMGLAFGALTVPLVYLSAKFVRRDDAGESLPNDDLPLYAAALLAGYAQFAIWDASGLENAIVNFAMALALWRSLVEQDAKRWQISPWAWLLLALSRPEGIAYAALGGFWQMVWSLADGRGLVPTIRWLAVFFAPWTVYQVAHYEYFAWPFPNTAYAKLDQNDFQPFGWNVKGWKYIRDWSFNLGQAWLLPLYLGGLLGWKQWRGAAAVALTALLALALVPGSAVVTLAPLVGWLDKGYAAGVNASLLHPPAGVDGLVGYGVSRALWLGLAGVGGYLGWRRWKSERGVFADVIVGFLAGGALPWVGYAALEGFDAVAQIGPVADRDMGGFLTVLLGVPALIGLGIGAGMAAAKRQLTSESRAALALGALLLAVRAVVYGLQLELPEAVPGWHLNFVGFRVVTLAIVALLAPLLAIGRPGWRPLVLSAQLAVFALVFALWSGGDWMKQYRWMASLSVPAPLLLAAGLAELQDRAQRAFGGAIKDSRWTFPAHTLGIAFVALFATVNIHNLAVFAQKPETGPFSVKKRVDYMKWVAKKLHIDDPVTDLDVDQGAHLFWSGFQMMDMAGLIEVPFAHHRDYPDAFEAEYLFREMRPQFAHVHGGWANTSKITSHAEWKRDYFEIPGYASAAKGTTLHVGNHVRKDLFVKTAWDGPADRRVAFEEGVVLDGFAIPSDVAGQSMHMYVEVGLHTTHERTNDDVFRVTMFLADAAGNVLSWDLAPGYDWWEVGDWGVHDVFWGRYSLPIPKTAAAGTYTVGFVVTGKDGHVLRPLGALSPAVDPTTPATPADPNAPPPPPAEALPTGAIAGGMADVPAVYATGEVRFPITVDIVTKDAIAERTTADLAALSTAATAGDCEGAEADFLLAKRRNTWDDGWLSRNERRSGPELAGCWARRATSLGAGPDHRDEAIAAIKRARRWAHDDDAVLAASKPLADAWYAEGMAARAQAQWGPSYEAFTAALAAEPWRAWARRYAEDARDHRLGLEAYGPKGGKKTRPAPKSAPPFLGGELGPIGLPMPDPGATPTPPPEGTPPAEGAAPDGANEE